jgi:hypothetical protein
MTSEDKVLRPFMIPPAVEEALQRIAATKSKCLVIFSETGQWDWRMMHMYTVGLSDSREVLGMIQAAHVRLFASGAFGTISLEESYHPVDEGPVAKKE